MKITRKKLENQQIWIYGFSLIFGGLLGISNKDLGARLDYFATHSHSHVVIPIYILFLIITPLVSRFIAYVFKLDKGEGRALIFSTGTRNSLVVHPLALSLPESWAR